MKVLPIHRKRKRTNENRNSLNFTLFGDTKDQDSEARRTRKPILYAFPSFDKCDSLLYFPSTFTRHVNSSDFKSLSKLFCSYLDKNCNIDLLRFPIKPTVKNFTALCEITNQLYPDTTMCVHHTKVIGNQIHSTIYSKFTECRAIYKALERTIKNEMLTSIMNYVHPHTIKQRLYHEPIKPDFRHDVLKLIDTGNDLLIYMKCNLILTLDEFSKKIINFSLEYILTDVRAVENNY